VSAAARGLAYGLACLGAALLAGCERPPIDSVQTGYRGTGMVQVYNPRTMATVISLNQAPAQEGPASPDGPRAKEIFKNLQVLGDLSIGELTAQMAAITAWVAPVEGCNYCHLPENLADDSKYTKVVARRMIQMTRHINSDWKTHVAATGVTCFTCHRGQPVPSQTWTAIAPQPGANFIGNRNGQNTPGSNVGLSALTSDPFTPLLKNSGVIRVAGSTALPRGNQNSIQKTEDTYALMVHMSEALGVNCTFCHNSRAFGNWGESTPKRNLGWYGIRMVNDLNTDYLEPLGKSLPPLRLGPTGDAPKVFCATCHQGAYKPLFGAAMAKDYPGLTGPSAAPKAVLPPPIAEALRSVLYFDVGSPVLQDTQAGGLRLLVVSLRASPRAKATVSGYHSAAGTQAQNEELAKQRAFTVRDSLVAAGIDKERVILAKPQQTSANVAGEDPSARRVEVTVK
jgi:photosynthetic reaction center cytochrome c subunit